MQLRSRGSTRAHRRTLKSGESHPSPPIPPEELGQFARDISTQLDRPSSSLTEGAVLELARADHHRPQPGRDGRDRRRDHRRGGNSYSTATSRVRLGRSRPNSLCCAHQSQLPRVAVGRRQALHPSVPTGAGRPAPLRARTDGEHKKAELRQTSCVHRPTARAGDEARIATLEQTESGAGERFAAQLRRNSARQGQVANQTRAIRASRSAPREGREARRRRRGPVCEHQEPLRPGAAREKRGPPACDPGEAMPRAPTANSEAADHLGALVDAS